MAVITLPAGCEFEDAKLTLSRHSVAMRSRYTGKRQVMGLPYALWVFEGQMPSKDQAKAAPWRSFLAQLDGQVNTFRLPVPGVTKPLSNYSGPTGSVAGATYPAGAQSVATAGWAPGALVMKDGDYFNIGDELKLCTADVVADGSGGLMIPFKPPLRNAAPVGRPIWTLNPFIYVSAQTDDIATWSLSKPVQHKFVLALIEAIE